MNMIFFQLPIDILEKIYFYVYKNTNCEKQYLITLKKILQCELKMNFCYNCRRFLQFANYNLFIDFGNKLKSKISKITGKYKIINKKYTDNWDIILRNIYNTSCILEKYNENTNIMINHWYMKDLDVIRTPKMNASVNKFNKYIKIDYKYNKYYKTSINEIK